MSCNAGCGSSSTRLEAHMRIEQIVAQMRADWNRRAQINAKHFILSGRDEWAWEDFIQTGIQDVERFLLPHVHRCGIDPGAARVLDFGCGIGRLSQALARRFKSVTAVDLSDEMLAQGRTNFSDLTNIRWLQFDGVSLSDIPGASHDVVFSYLVLQHVPEAQVALGYLAEFCRVLAPGGLLCVQFAYRRAYWLRRLYVAVWARLARADALWRRLAPERWRRRRYGREEWASMETLMQHSLSPGRAARVVRERGLMVETLDDADPLNIWLVARKPLHARAD